MHNLRIGAVAQIATFLAGASLLLMSLTGCNELQADSDRIGTSSTAEDLDVKAPATDFPRDEIVDATYVPNSSAPFPTKIVRNYRDFDTGSRIAALCTADARVAFSVAGNSHVSAGSLTFLGYATTITNIGGGWVNGGGTFVAPCDGIYAFTTTFVNDPFYYGGTTDDVYIYTMKNGVSAGFAWSGEGDGRRAGTHTISLWLQQGDYVQTFTGSDGGRNRHLSVYEFTGFLVR